MHPSAQPQPELAAALLEADPEARLAAMQREFGEYGGVNASVETSTTFTGAHPGRPGSSHEARLIVGRPGSRP